MANILTKFKMITRGFSWDKIWDIIDDNFLRANKEINDLNDTMDSVVSDFATHKQDVETRVARTERIATDARTEFLNTQAELDQRVNQRLSEFETRYDGISADVANRYNLLYTTLSREITRSADSFDGQIIRLNTILDNHIAGSQSTIDAALETFGHQYTNMRTELNNMISENRAELYRFVEGKADDVNATLSDMDNRQTESLRRANAAIDTYKAESDEEFMKIQARYALTNQRFQQDELRLSTLESSVSSSVSSLNAVTETHSQNFTELFQRVQSLENRIELNDSGLADAVSERVMDRFSTEMSEIKALLTAVSSTVEEIRGWKDISEELNSEEEQPNSGE